MRKTIITVLGTIILGAIGSGLWDLVLSDLIAWIGSGVLSFFSSLFKGYLDILYSDVGKGSLYPLVKEPFEIVLSFMIAIPIFLTLRVKRKIGKLKKMVSSGDPIEDEDTNTIIDEIDRHFKFKILPILAFVIVFVTLQIWQGLYSHSVSSFSERSIDIVAPYISDQEFKEINSLYRSIDSANKFYAFRESLEKIATDNKIELPKFNGI